VLVSRLLRFPLLMCCSALGSLPEAHHDHRY
jgi:hypothetical protein